LVRTRWPYRREQLRTKEVVSARELKNCPLTISQLLLVRVINSPEARNRLKDFIFLTLEDETGHANVVVMPDVYSLDPMVVLHERFIQ